MKCKFAFAVLLVLGLALVIVVVRYVSCSILCEESRGKRMCGSGAIQETYADDPNEVGSCGAKRRWIGMPIEIGSSNAPVFAINAIEGSTWPRRTHGVIVALWRDGRVIWSQDDVCGGPPYFEGNVPEKGVEAFVSKVARLQVVFKGPEFAYFHAQYEPPWTIMSINSGRHSFQVISAHEHIENGKDRICTMRGIRYLKKGETRESVMAEQPFGYRRCRSAWETIRSSARALVRDGKPVQVNFEIRRIPVVE